MRKNNNYQETGMSELTEEQKYAKKAEMLKRALAAADEMDKKDAEKAQNSEGHKDKKPKGDNK